MPFNYDPLTNIGKVRLYTGDVNEGQGKRPENKNFTDEEIQVFLDNSKNNLTGAVVAALMTLSSEWSDYAVSEWVALAQQKFDAKQVAKNFQDRADYFLKNPIEGLQSGGKYGVVELKRSDAWTEAAKQSEYG